MINRKYYSKIYYLIYFVFFTILTFFYLQKISAFGCFDDCNNILGGYFLLKDKQIFSDFFFNHAPLMAHVSYLIQKITSPDGIYNLILYHRIFLFGFSFLFGVLLIFRFKLLALLFLITFESTKYFIFGDRFLAESFIIYPIIYLFGITLYKIENFELKKYDYYLLGIFVWFIIFMREPYIPLTLLMFFILMIGKRTNEKIVSLILFSTLTLITFLTLPIKEMYENVYLYNKGITASELGERGNIIKIIFTSFTYPLYIFISGNQTVFKLIEQLISVSFLFGAFNAFLIKKYKLILIIILILGISNIRFTDPGKMFFGSFHMIIWYSLFIFSTYYLISILKSNKNRFLIFIPVLIAVIISLTSKESFTNRNIDKFTEFEINYKNYFVYGKAINDLSKETQTLFLEERDDLIYWVADRPSAYKYQWFTSLMPQVEKYTIERKNMFINNPPDFYYDACIHIKNKLKDPIGFTRLKQYNKASCLLVKNHIYESIPNENWKRIEYMGFTKN